MHARPHSRREKDIKRALDRERAEDDKETQVLDEIARYQAGLTDDAQRMQSLHSLKRLLADLNAQATAAEESPERARARRVLRVVTMGAAKAHRIRITSPCSSSTAPPRGR